MKRLKILFLTSWYPTTDKPVLGTFTLEHAKAVSLYDDVVVLHHAGTKSDMSKLWLMELDENDNFYNGIPTYHVWTKFSAIPKLSFLLSIWGIIRAIQEIIGKGFHPDIFHAHIYNSGIPAIILGKLLHIPVVLTEHSSAFPRNLLSKTEKWKASLVLNNVDLVMPVSIALSQAISNFGIKKKQVIVPNAVDYSIFHPNDFSKKGNSTKRLLFVGLLDPTHNKGIPYLLMALSKLKDIRTDWNLEIIGDGPARSQYEDMVLKMDLYPYVTFQGVINKAAVAEFMRKGDVLIVPSIFETFSVVTIEALISGLPVIATMCGGPEELITNNSGILVKIKDGDELFNAILSILTNLSFYNSKDISNYAREKFSLESVGAEIQRNYLNVLGMR